MVWAWAGHVDRRDEASVPQLALPLLDVWLVLYSVGQILLLILLGTMLLVKRPSSSTRRRNPILINLVLCAFLSSVPPCLLYYAGDASVASPPAGLCLAQETLKHGGDPMFIVSVLTLVVEFVTHAKAAMAARVGQAVCRTTLLLAVPYITFFAFSLPSLALGLIHPEHVHRAAKLFYCTLHNNVYGDIATVFGILVVIVSVVLEIYIICVLRRSWRAVQQLSSPLELLAPSSRDIDLPLLIRVGTFTILEIFFIMISLVQLAPTAPSNVNAIATVYEACLPICIFLIFGVRSEFIRFWLAPFHIKDAGWQSPFWLIKSAASSAEDAHVQHNPVTISISQVS